jgi:hypothetical protein
MKFKRLWKEGCFPLFDRAGSNKRHFLVHSPEVHNNKTESLFGNTVRQREKTMRGLKTENSAILKGM